MYRSCRSFYQDTENKIKDDAMILLQQNKKKRTEDNKCHAKTMMSQYPISLEVYYESKVDTQHVPVKLRTLEGQT
jgi:hypothetical protein